MKKILLTLILLFCISMLYAEVGIASWYTSDKPKALTANGEDFDNNALTAAHKTLTFGSVVEVKNLDNGKTITVRINDRGPYVDERIIDLTPEGAKQLEFYKNGIAKVELTVLSTPKTPVTKYLDGNETGWYTLQIGSYTNIKNAYSVYQNLVKAGLKPTVEIVNDSMVRLSVTNIQKYKLDAVKESLAKIGITEPLTKGCKNPYN